MIEAEPMPEALVAPDGTVRLGVFEEPCRNVNLEEAHLTLAGARLPRALVRFQLKEWQHFLLVLPDAFVGLAVVDAKLLAKSWCHFGERPAGEHFEHARQGPFAERSVARELWDDRTSFRARGYHLEIHNHLDSAAHRLFVDIESSRGKPAIQADLTCHHHLSEIRPLVVMLPVGRNRAMYSHKVALPLEGQIEVGGRQHVADPESCFAILDIHKAHYPHHTWWHWATFAGSSPEGRLIALNVTRNVNRQDERYNENALWVDGRIQHLAPAVFDFDAKQVLEPWRIRTADDRVALVFRPSGERREKMHAGIVKSVFHQPYGTFEGEVRFGDETLAIDSLFGVCEVHDALW